MSEIKPSNPLIKETVFGNWEYDQSGNIAWKKTTVKKEYNSLLHEWVSLPEQVEFQKPEQRGLAKEVNTCFIFKKDIKSDDFGATKPQFYKLQVKFKVNGNQGSNIWLRDSGKVYLLNINPEMPQAIECPHTSSENVTVKRMGRPIKISLQEAQRIIKSGNRYVFGRIVQSGEGVDNIEFVTCV
jgi:hypothetical protein